MRRAVLLALVTVCLTAGIRPAPNRSNTSDPLDIVYIGDTHWTGIISTGDNQNDPLSPLGRDRLRSMVAWSNANADIDAWIIGGDWSWTGALASAELRDSLVALLTTGLNVPCVPVVGNWEVDYADSGTGLVYNNFTANFPGYFAQYETPGKRGRRWFSHRFYTSDGGRTNVNLWVGQNNRDLATGDGNYQVNNPKDGSGVSNTDFDGWAINTSGQWTDFQAWYNTLESGDWAVLAMHRTHHGGGAVSNRPDVEGESSADSSTVAWMDANYTSNKYLLLEADNHENKVIGQIGQHYTIAACMVARQKDDARLGDWIADALQFSYNDSTFDASRGLGLVDSLGAEGGGKDFDGNKGSGLHGWNLFQRLTFQGNNLDVRTYLVVNFEDIVLVDSLRVTR